MTERLWSVVVAASGEGFGGAATLHGLCTVWPSVDTTVLRMRTSKSSSVGSRMGMSSCQQSFVTS